MTGVLRRAERAPSGAERYDIPGHPNLYVEAAYDNPEPRRADHMPRANRYAWMVVDRRFDVLERDRLWMAHLSIYLSGVREWIIGGGPEHHERKAQAELLRRDVVNRAAGLPVVPEGR